MAEKVKRGFRGVWIPAEIWLSEDLTLMEKLFLVEIDSLDNDKGCYASNKHFAKFFDISKSRCSQIINSLKRKKMISVSYIRDGKEVKTRVIKKLNTPIKNIKGGYLENLQGYLENAKESNTYSNTLDSNTDILSSSDEHDVIPYKEIVDYLNEKAGTKFRSQTKDTQKHIRARVNEGFTIDDFKKVINTKTSQWLNDPKMNAYLRPATLFGTKFEGYLNEQSETGDQYEDLGF